MLKQKYFFKFFCENTFLMSIDIQQYLPEIGVVNNNCLKPVS